MILEFLFGKDILWSNAGVYKTLQKKKKEPNTEYCVADNCAIANIP